MVGVVYTGNVRVRNSTKAQLAGRSPRVASNEKVCLFGVPAGRVAPQETSVPAKRASDLIACTE